MPAGFLPVPATGKLIPLSRLDGIRVDHPLLKDPSPLGVRRKHPLVRGVAARLVDDSLDDNESFAAFASKRPRSAASRSSPALGVLSDAPRGAAPAASRRIRSEAPAGRRLDSIRRSVNWNEGRQNQLVKSRLNERRENLLAARDAESNHHPLCQVGEPVPAAALDLGYIAGKPKKDWAAVQSLELQLGITRSRQLSQEEKFVAETRAPSLSSPEELSAKAFLEWMVRVTQKSPTASRKPPTRIDTQPRSSRIQSKKVTVVQKEEEQVEETVEVLHDEVAKAKWASYEREFNQPSDLSSKLGPNHTLWAPPWPVASATEHVEDDEGRVQEEPATPTEESEKPQEGEVPGGDDAYSTRPSTGERPQDPGKVDSPLHATG
eukprot:TRINITY_DN17853_c0_g1_i1.p1 TRINITY_DN17853_c0_g1~~TRINITY_DN17853_c0_g1_i1.p1  ORF type:complete len:378 (-),score=54.98 TRINITY_DN17853_c0_g1_i1:342-1475(-)